MSQYFIGKITDVRMYDTALNSAEIQQIYNNEKVGKMVMNVIKKVVFSHPATIVFWKDGTKTVVKTSPNDKFDREKGILWAYYLKYTGTSKTQAQKIIAKHCEGEK